MKKIFGKIGQNPPLRITLYYLILGGLWIILSDELLQMFLASSSSLTKFQTLKGWFFVAVTALIFYILIRNSMSKIIKSEEALRGSEERLELALKASKQGLWDWNVITNKVFFDEQWAEMLGYDLAETDGTYQFWEKLVHPDDLNRVQAALESHFGGTSPYFESEYRLLTREGKWKWILDLGKVVSRRRDGKPVRMIGTHLDITGRKNAEQQLHESQRKLATLISNLPGMAYRCKNDEKMTMLFASQGCHELTGYSAEELIQNQDRNLAQLIHPQDSPDVLASIREATKSKHPFQITYRIKSRDGQEKWVWEQGQAVSLDSGGQEILESFVIDISDRVKAERALEIRNLQYQSFIHNSLVGIWRLDFREPIPTALPSREIARQILETGYFSECNDAFAKMYGASSQEEWIGRPLNDVVVNFEVSLGRVEKVVLNDFKTELIDNEEKDSRGNIRYFRNSYFGFVENNALQWMWGIQLDITEHKRLEAQYQQAQKMEAIGNLAGGIAHDFNNLMTVVNGYSELLLNELHEPAKLETGIRAIQKAGMRAASLTTQLLAFSRQQIIQPKIIHLNQTVSDITGMLRRLIGEDVELSTHLAPGLRRIEIDPGQIEQVIMNLAVNARDAMPQGGKLDIETMNIDLDEKYTRQHVDIGEGKYVMLVISDTGVGMEETTKQKIFEPFFTTKSKDKGTGLGLSTVYGIVRQNKGAINVYSEPGKGTIFKIYLPAVATESEESGLRTDHPETQVGTESILVVEDEEMVRSLVCNILQSHGYDVQDTTSPQHALDICEQSSRTFHLMITDVIMPGLSGPELAEKCLKIRPELKVLYLSGYTERSIVNHGIVEDDISFLQKPFSSAALLQKVREVIDSEGKIQELS